MAIETRASKQSMRKSSRGSRKSRSLAASGTSLPAQIATNRPATPPATESTRLSVTSWRTSRVRVAPSASRTAISRRLPKARASSMVAMLTHAMSRTNPAAISSTSRTPPAMPRLRGPSVVLRSRMTPDRLVSSE